MGIAVNVKSTSATGPMDQLTRVPAPHFPVDLLLAPHFSARSLRPSALPKPSASEDSRSFSLTGLLTRLIHPGNRDSGQRTSSTPQCPPFQLSMLLTLFLAAMVSIRRTQSD